jgi:transposase-like protein
MITKKRKEYDGDIKLKVILELLREEKTLAELASKYGIAPRNMTNWKKQFLENASMAFNKEKVVKIYKKQITDLQSQQEELYKEIGKLIAKLSWAEKKIESLESN